MWFGPLKLLGMHGSGCGISFWPYGTEKDLKFRWRPWSDGTGTEAMDASGEGWRAWSGHCGARRLATVGSFSRQEGTVMGFHLLNYLLRGLRGLDQSEGQ